MDKFQLADLQRSDLESILGVAPLTALLGSGISRWYPTDLATGQEVTDSVFEVLFDAPELPEIDDRDRAWLKVLTVTVPFETLMERCPNQERLRALILELFGRSREPNPVHKALAYLAAKKRFASIITTNYDLALDNALIEASANLHFVFKETQSDPAKASLYFKIHGSAEAGSEDSLVYSLRLEAALAPWKRTTLRKLLRKRTLIIIGYSGLDFEVCPEVPGSDPLHVVWNFYTENDMERSPGLKRLQAGTVATTVLIGDMRDLLNLLDCNVHAKPATTDHRQEVSTRIRNAFSTEELTLWRACVLNSMGCPRLALQALKALGPEARSNYSVLKEYGDSLHHLGRYRRAESIYLRAASVAPSEVGRRTILLAASDAIRCYGHWWRARRLIDSSVAGLDSSTLEGKAVRARELLERTLVKRHWIRVAEMLWMKSRADQWREHTIKWIKEGTQLALENGLWFDFQQYRFWADRLGLSAGRTKGDGPFEPPPTRQGYLQLGYQLPLIMSRRDQARAELKSGSLGKDTMSQLEECLTLIQQLGSHAETWKVARVLLRIGPLKKSLRYTVILFRNFFRCQYAPTKRVFFLMIGD